MFNINILIRGLVILIAFFLFGSTYAQRSDSLPNPELGKPMPDFTIRHIAYYPKKQASVRDFRGKWLLLDFWDRGCSSCIAGFPELNSMLKELGYKVQVMLVCDVDAKGRGEEAAIYNRFREREELIMPCAFDSDIVRRFGWKLFPHTFLVDPDGIVRSNGIINFENVKGFVSGNPPSEFKNEGRKYQDFTHTYNGAKLFEVDNNGAPDSEFIFRSVLAKWRTGMPVFVWPGVVGNPQKGTIEALGTPIENLYNYAYMGSNYDLDPTFARDSLMYGNYFTRPVLEGIPDSVFSSAWNLRKNIYCYSLKIPAEKSSEEILRKIMQGDLHTYFGYEAALETRSCPYWKLIALPGTAQRLLTKGGMPEQKGLDDSPVARFGMGSSLNNMPFHAPRLREDEFFPGGHNLHIDVYGQILGYSDSKERDDWSNIILDETGLTENVDIKLDMVQGGFQSVLKALRANGLDLVKAEKDMKVVVIRPAR